MDLQKIKVAKDLKRIAINYYLLKEITKEESDRFCQFINAAADCFLTKPYTHNDCKVIPFPTSYTGPEILKAPEKETSKQPAQSHKIYAPYGKPLPEGVHDFRQTLQRDGLVLIYYEMRTNIEGNFFNVLWAKSNSNSIPKRRLTAWSGLIREEEIPYVFPMDGENLYYGYEKDYSFCYSVGVAPDNILKGPVQDFYDYVESLKAADFKNNFDYVFNFAAEKRDRYIKKNKELISLKLPPRVINPLNERDIYKKKDLLKISIQELQKIRNLRASTIDETITILKAAGITLQEKPAESKTNYGRDL